MYYLKATIMAKMKIIRTLTTLLIFLLVTGNVFATESKPIVILTTFSEYTISQQVEQYRQLFPNTEVRVIFRRTRSALRLLAKDDAQNIDIIISSSPVLFNHLSTNKQLYAINSPHQVPSWLSPHVIDISGETTAFGYSGFGLMANRQYLASHHLPTPKSWEDLTNAMYFHHITMSTPSRSGTTSLMVENILQHYGWKDGWELLMQIGGNIAFISSRSFGVSEAISKGLIGAAPVIDSYAINSKKVFNYIDFNYLPNSILMPAYVGIAKKSHSISNAKNFVDFLLSDSGQRALEKSSMAKYSLNQPQLAESTSFILNKQLLHRRDALISLLFDQAITEQLHQLNSTWASIHQLEATNNMPAEAHNKLLQAKQYAAKVPVTEEQSRSPVYLAQFHRDGAKRGRDPVVAAEIQRWKEALKQNLQQANHLLNQINQE
ncbi:ABC transporter substrate-binding protein [Photobacterium sp.]|uniref:ABC transporter substrate-binding protein n=1 Tax=Photobacterium sp. TaxID=660 RepID=UPI00299D2B44|nr:ABC transporter substrate-binding protein [Photobacterium sp.]MDX1304316.1 ABC transporter substrate-binding protein [Photobacterium sp.]